MLHHLVGLLLRALYAQLTGTNPLQVHLWWGIGSGLVAGMLLWSFLPSVILRALPQNWHMPEAMAAHIIGEPTLWEAGTRLMRADSPQTWNAITDAANMLRENRNAIANCRNAADQAGKPVRCTLEVKPHAWP